MKCKENEGSERIKYRGTTKRAQPCDTTNRHCPDWRLAAVSSAWRSAPEKAPPPILVQRRFVAGHSKPWWWQAWQAPTRSLSPIFVSIGGLKTPLLNRQWHALMQHLPKQWFAGTAAGDLNEWKQVFYRCNRRESLLHTQHARVVDVLAWTRKQWRRHLVCVLLRLTDLPLDGDVYFYMYCTYVLYSFLNQHIASVHLKNRIKSFIKVKQLFGQCNIGWIWFH